MVVLVGSMWVLNDIWVEGGSKCFWDLDGSLCSKRGFGVYRRAQKA